MELVKVAPAELDSWDELRFCCLILMFLRSATNPGFEMWTSIMSMSLVNLSRTSDIGGRNLAVSCTQSSPNLRNFKASSSGKFILSMGSTSFSRSLPWYAVHAWNCKNMFMFKFKVQTQTHTCFFNFTKS